MPNKYRPFPAIDLPDRQWPSRKITSAPRWLSTDLRDGNQAIEVPMNGDTKLEFFKMLVDIGLKEIEVGFPSASDTEFDFMRRLIEENHIPDDVTIQVLTQATPRLIERTMESLKGARQAIVHIYSGTSAEFRELVLGKNKQEVIDMTVDSVRQIRRAAERQPETNFILEYSAEHFSQTEVDYARDIFEAVMAEWGATPARKVILNMPATVEICDPEEYADMVEWISRHLSRRDSAILSVHPHNDRGMGVAAAQMAIKAGADRVEGCLFGNGERTGNVDYMIIAMNMYTKGIDPELDFSDMPRIVEVYERATGMKVPPRHPYAGALVFTAFSGSHQDAIKKGFDRHGKTGRFEVPYFIIDPEDLGRSWEETIRVNSQSGKAGAAFVLQQTHGIELPKAMQPEFGQVVQRRAEASGGEVSATEIWDCFREEYLNAGPVAYKAHQTNSIAGSNGQAIALTLSVNGRETVCRDRGTGAIDAAVNALRLPVEIVSFDEKSLGRGADARAIAFVGIRVEGQAKVYFGAAVDTDTGTAGIRAVIGGINRLVRHGQLDLPEALAGAPSRPQPVAEDPGAPRF